MYPGDTNNLASTSSSKSLTVQLPASGGLVELPDEVIDSIWTAYTNYALSPGFDKTASLGGTDTNADGIRDDVYAFIQAWPSLTAAHKAASVKYAKSLQTLMTQVNFGSMDANGNVATPSNITFDNAFDMRQTQALGTYCLGQMTGYSTSSTLASIIRLAILNTPERLEQNRQLASVLSGSPIDDVNNAVCN